MWRATSGSILSRCAKWVRQAEVDGAPSPSGPLTSAERNRLGELEREAKESSRAMRFTGRRRFLRPRVRPAPTEDRVHRRAPGPVRRRADLPRRGRVGQRLLRAPPWRAVGTRRRRRAVPGPDPGRPRRELRGVRSAEVSRGALAKGQAITSTREGPSFFFATPHVPSGPVTIFNQSVLP